MKLASFTVDGRPTFGLVVGDDALIDVGAKAGDRYPSLRRLVASGELDAVMQAHASAAADYRFDQVHFLPPITRPFHIISTGGNFPLHYKEMIEGGMSKGPPPFPGCHFKTIGSLVGHREPIVKPKMSNDFDYELEFAVIISKAGRHIQQEAALDHILGYSAFLDGSIRDVQLSHSVSAGKNFERSSSFGPWICTKDEVGDIDPLWCTTRLNGEVVQHEQIGTLTFPMAYLVSYYSSFVHLQPGDVITSGSLGGVGYFRKPPLYMKAGDRLELEVDKIGVMTHTVIDE